ncbi:MAG: FAD-dependent oxidoreductase [Nanoarchaeota archaeon]|nr:FAD-dependent oxidoreductase [Nanoarchaeota archaeon]
MYDLIIIGGGVSGFSGAMYAGRFGMKTLVFTGPLKGGMITWAKEVCNYPGFKSISGLELAQKIEAHAKDYDIEIKNGIIDKIEKTNEGFKVFNKKEKYEAKTILYAAGTEVRKLNIDNEESLKNNGVHYCALCDGAFYKDKVVAVIGGSDSATIEALILSDIAKKVYIIYRRGQLRAEKINQEALEKKENIEILYNTNVIGLVGQKKLEKVLLDKEFNDSKELFVDGVFVSIGHIPNSGLVKPLSVELNEKGFIATDKDSCTNVEGFFAAGDITDRSFKQAVTGVAEAVVAVYNAYKFCKH